MALKDLVYVTYRLVCNICKNQYKLTDLPLDRFLIYARQDGWIEVDGKAVCNNCSGHGKF